MISRSATFIRDAVAQLYRTTEIAEPTSRHCIAPLGELVEHFNLTCTELAQLSEQVAMRYLLERGGIVEMPERMSLEALAGFLHVDVHYGSIFVEIEDLLVRRRFSVAHELGHYLLHFQPLLSMAKEDQEYCEMTDAFSRADAQSLSEQRKEDLLGASATAEIMGRNVQQLLPPLGQMEGEANQFAAELLMPFDVIEGLLARYATYLHGDDLIWRLSTEMLVSGESVHWRLHNLGLLSFVEKKLY